MFPSGSDEIPVSTVFSAEEQMRKRTKWTNVYLWNADAATEIFDALQTNYELADKARRLLTTAGKLREILSSVHDATGLNFIVPAWTGNRNNF